MNWFQQNRWLGTFITVVGLCTLLAIYFVWSAKSSADDAAAQFAQAASERSRLEQLDPFPSEANYRKMKVHIENYSASLQKLKEDLKTRVLPATPLAPNEFQTRLRQAMLATAEKARANRVKLPDNFALGFDEFTVALPNTADAPLLGQELAQAELLLNILIEARVDSVTVFKRSTKSLAPVVATANPTPAPKAAAPRGATPNVIERGIIDLTFTAAPGGERRALNQIASSSQQFYILRSLHVRNEKEKGPPREQPAQPGAAAAQSPAPARPAPNAALSFIVGNEHVETSARIELVRFNL